MNNDERRGLPSASKMYRLANCSGSLALENQVKGSARFFELPDAAQASGLRIHDWLARNILGEIQEEGILNADERATARMCISLLTLLLEQWEAKNGSGNSQIIVEQRFWYRRALFDRAFSGQPDYVKINREAKRALIVNWKTGRTEAQVASDNLQLRTEIVLVKHNFPHLAEISAAIIEPWVSWEPVQVRYTEDDLREATNQILAIVTRANWEHENRVAGDWCKYCAARAYCPEALSYIQTIPAFNAEVAIRELPRGEAGTLLWEKLKIAKRLIDSLEAAYEQILGQEPDALPGYVLPAQGKARRIVPYPAKLKSALAEHLSSDEIDGCATYHLAKISELLGLKHAIAGKDLRDLFSDLTRDAVETIFDRPFIRAQTRKEREGAPTLEERNGNI